ncbi:MAG: pyridoxamine 5'-phosphate oxidase family protein [Chloroflexota bacterium]
MAKMSVEQREGFLATVRLGLLTMLRKDGGPTAVPVWFEWDGTAVRVFTGAGSLKVKRLARDPRISLLVVNNVGEPEGWVAFDGRVTIKTEGAIELAERLAERYWDMADPNYQITLDSWRQGAANLRVLELVPEVIRTG